MQQTPRSRRFNQHDPRAFAQTVNSLVIPEHLLLAASLLLLGPTSDFNYFPRLPSVPEPQALSSNRSLDLL